MGEGRGGAISWNCLRPPERGMCSQVWGLQRPHPTLLCRELGEPGTPVKASGQAAGVCMCMCGWV